jgi:antitoxin ParD1/3/4
LVGENRQSWYILEAKPSSQRTFDIPTHSVNLTDHLDQFVEDEVEAGRYQDASEVMRAGLNLLEQQRREEHEKLQLDQGLGIELKDEQELADFMREIGCRAVEKANRHSRDV